MYALRDIVKINDKVILKIAGSGQNRDELIHLSKILQIENHVQFLGSLSRAEIIHEYSTSDILINTSIVDNMPNSLLESMASGLPIVSYKVGGISFFLKHKKNVLFVPINNYKKFAMTTCQLIDNDHLRNKIIRNNLLDVETFTWDKVKKLWIEIYNMKKVKWN